MSNEKFISTEIMCKKIISTNCKLREIYKYSKITSNENFISTETAVSR